MNYCKFYMGVWGNFQYIIAISQLYFGQQQIPTFVKTGLCRGDLNTFKMNFT